MMTERNKDILFCGLAVIMALIVLAISLSYQSTSAYFPQILAVFIAVLAVMLAIDRLKSPSEGERDESNADLAGFAKVAISILAYVAAMLVIGFTVATGLFLILMMVILGERRPLLILSTSFGLTGLLYFLFFWFLGVYPPEAMFSL